MAKQKRNYVNILAYLFVVLLVLAICGGVVYFTNGLTTDFKSFYLKVDGKDVLENKGGYMLSTTEPLSIETKYVLGLFKKDLSGYSYSITANPEADFGFKVGEDSYNFAGDNLDFKKCFDITETETGLSLTAKGTDMETMLVYIFPNGAITLDDEVDYDKDLFLLTVKSYNDKVSITLGLRLVAGIKGITLDKTEIVF